MKWKKCQVEMLMYAFYLGKRAHLVVCTTCQLLFVILLVTFGTRFYTTHLSFLDQPGSLNVFSS